jgi:hypothetical protein
MVQILASKSKKRKEKYSTLIRKIIIAVTATRDHVSQSPWELTPLYTDHQVNLQHGTAVPTELLLPGSYSLWAPSANP